MTSRLLGRLGGAFALEMLVTALRPQVQAPGGAINYLPGAHPPGP